MDESPDSLRSTTHLATNSTTTTGNSSFMRPIVAINNSLPSIIPKHTHPYISGTISQHDNVNVD